ncbi:hypothetical protein GLAREA_04384 [Glarea lozoyensis ATCC 20868]|uniref:Uncharacterized protein n=2 Tax=Glarea lozoyensis TaxID=101852 RepID=S3DM40_GLAL2|nr:uncharacterized protein GLAREA_04384 [Glarea lozoyensis ATCC 20868]EHL01775.1 hypothetical protein M7I_2125 [Glarea lozoyensis 74030]EPE27593.1 hypothetical protein GLAREA_04384 [Glarea lozoyensis ATCC 20868]
MSANPDAVSNQGEFRSKVPRAEPMMKGGHSIGTKVGNDAAPEFHAQTLPAGTAPKSSTYTPNTQSEIPGQAMNPNIAKETWTRAEDTLGGATSKDVHTGLGHPGSGQTSNEMRQHKERNGLEGTGASVGEMVPRGLERDDERAGMGMEGRRREDLKDEGDRLNETAESVASERRG